jgi:hypothetical protein
MKKLPEDWELVESYEGNLIFEHKNGDFSVSIDNMGSMMPPYEIVFQQLKGVSVKIGFEDGAYTTHGTNQQEAIERACTMMNFINLNYNLKKIS